MNLLKKIAFGLAAILVGLVWTTAPAQAGTGSCPNTRKACVWNSGDWSGTPYAMGITSGPAAACTNLPSNWKNIGSSFGNTSSDRYIYWYDGDNCTGTMLLAQEPQSFDGGLQAWQNNKANSFWVPSNY